MSKISSKHAAKTRHTSIDMSDPECVKKKQDMLTRARNKLWNLSDALKQGKVAGMDKEQQRKSRTQATLDYFFKSSAKDKAFATSNGKRALQKQNSIGSYPIKIEITDEDSCERISRLRPATVCVDRMFNEADALALERPRKKLSFREPEIMGYAIHVTKGSLPRKSARHLATLETTEMRRSLSESDGILQRGHSVEDLALEVVFRAIKTSRFGVVSNSVGIMWVLSVAEPGYASGQDDRTVF